MSESETQKWLILTSKLLAATQKAAIKWVRVPGDHSTYETIFLGQKLQIWYDDRNSDVTLFFVDALGAITFVAPQTEGLDDLFNAARRQEANVDQFLEKVLAFNP